MKHELFKKLDEAGDAMAEAQLAYDAAHKAACFAPIPEKLRPAVASDIVEGARIWYPGHITNAGDPALATPDEYAHDWKAWLVVCEVLRPSDPWKAFSADDGCRYGLDGAFVEVE